MTHTQSSRRSLGVAVHGGILLALALGVGCTPSLESPERFLDASFCPTDIQNALFAPRCGLSGCHVQYEAAGGLDFVSPDLSHRLVDVEATTCGGRRLIDRDAPEESFILERLSADPRCGDEAILRMPAAGPHLTEEELDCVRAFVTSLAGGADVAR